MITKCSRRRKRYRLLIGLGRQLEPMPDALKTDATKGRGCAGIGLGVPGRGETDACISSPTAMRQSPRGSSALVLAAVQDRPAKTWRRWMSPPRSRPSSCRVAQRNRTRASRHDRPGTGHRPGWPHDDANRGPGRGSQIRPRAVLELARQVGHGARLVWNSGSAGDDWAELILLGAKRWSAFPKRILASCAIVSLIDTCSAMAVCAGARQVRADVTIDLRIDYVRPAFAQESVRARCECQQIDPPRRLTRGTAFVCDKPIAYSSGRLCLGFEVRLGVLAALLRGVSSTREALIGRLDRSNASPRARRRLRSG